MKKYIAARIIMGFPIGVAIGNIITVVISLVYGGGSYIVCTDEFIALIGSEAAAAALQTLLCGVIGTGFSLASLIWTNDSISLLKQTVLCFFIYSAILFPAAFFMGWMGRGAAGILIYAAIFAAVFALIWFIQFLFWRKNIKSINDVLKK